MKTQHFGIEIEMTGITRSKAASLMATFFGIGSKYHAGGAYDTYIAEDGQGRKWKAMNDSSLYPEKKVGGRTVEASTNYRTEVVSPILSYDDIPSLQELIRTLRKAGFRLTCDAAFTEVMLQCAGPRRREQGTWITRDMFRAYVRLHEMGYAHSIETWQGDTLAGGLYGVSLGRAFFGESMFHRISEASRAALTGLVDLLRLRGTLLLDCQQDTPHIMGMGGELVSRAAFEELLELAVQREADPACPLRWQPWRERYAHDGRQWHEVNRT